MTASLRSLLIACIALLAAPLAVAEPTADQFATALVTIESSIDADGRTVSVLGDSRAGTGVVIDSRGLIVTVGYLLLEATDITVSFYNGVQLPATVSTIDSESGLALLRISDVHAADLPAVTPVKLGQSTLLLKDDRVIALPAGGLEVAASVRIHSMREFVAPWEYLLEAAIYTMPPVRNFSGAALINRDAELIGIGTLALQDITDSEDSKVPGNLFIPVDILTSRLGAMLADSAAGASKKGRPWLGVMLDESLSVTRVLDESPALQAGVQVGDTILGFNDTHVESRARLYESLWSTSVADELALLVSREGRLTPIEVKPIDRATWLDNPQ